MGHRHHQCLTVSNAGKSWNHYAGILTKATFGWKRLPAMCKITLLNPSDTSYYWVYNRYKHTRIILLPQSLSVIVAFKGGLKLGGEQEEFKYFQEVISKWKGQNKPGFVKTKGLCVCKLRAPKAACLPARTVCHYAVLGWIRTSYQKGVCLLGFFPSVVSVSVLVGFFSYEILILEVGKCWV